MTTPVLTPRNLGRLQITKVKENLPYINLMIWGEPGVGKGHPVDTCILTPDGWTKLGDLEVGDQVIGSTGLPVTVTAIYERGVLDVFTVRFNDGAETICDGDHLWRVQHYSNKSWTVKSVRELVSIGIFANGSNASKYKIQLVEPVQFPEKTLPVDPYLMGVLLANAHLISPPTISTNDEEIIRRIQVRNSSLTLHEIDCPTRTARGWTIPGLGDVLRQLGLWGAKSSDKFIPTTYFTASVDARRELLAGLLDCDGTAAGRGSDGGNRVSYHSRSKDLAHGVRAIVESLGGTATIGSYLGRDGKDDYVVRITLPSNPFTLPRKAGLIDAQETKRKIASRINRRIRSIEPAGKAQVRCITVDAPDQLYVTERFVVTHNTRLAGTADDVPEMRKVLFVDMEAGTFSLRASNPNVDTVKVANWSEMQEVYDTLYAGGHDYETVVLDSLTEIQKFNMYNIMQEVAAENSKMDIDVPSMREWGRNLEQMRKFVRGFRNLPMNTIFTCLAKSDKNAMTGRIHKKPYLSGKLADEIAAFLDVVLYMYVKEMDGENQRYLLTASTEEIVAKDRSGALPQVVQNPNMADLYKMITANVKES